RFPQFFPRLRLHSCVYVPDGISGTLRHKHGDIVFLQLSTEKPPIAGFRITTRRHEPLRIEGVVRPKKRGAQLAERRQVRRVCAADDERFWHQLGTVTWSSAPYKAVRSLSREAHFSSVGKSFLTRPLNTWAPLTVTWTGLEKSTTSGETSKVKSLTPRVVARNELPSRSTSTRPLGTWRLRGKMFILEAPWVTPFRSSSACGDGRRVPSLSITSQRTRLNR